jgi:hypothetical protein
VNLGNSWAPRKPAAKRPIPDAIKKFFMFSVSPKEFNFECAKALTQRMQPAVQRDAASG